MDNTHQVAQRAAPECRIVYVENDPLVLAHARALLVNTTAGATAYVNCDLHEPDQVVGDAKNILDFNEPIEVMFMGGSAMSPTMGQTSIFIGSSWTALPPLPRRRRTGRAGQSTATG